MNTRFTAISAGIGLLISAVMMTLLFFGVSGVLILSSGTDLMHVLWPASVMLTTGWRTTPQGILITFTAVILNCATYMAVAFAGRGAARLIRT